MIALPQRKPALYDVVRVRPGHPVDGHDFCNELLTVAAVSDDGSEVDVTWWTGGPRLHFLAAWLVPVWSQAGVR